MFWVVRYCFSGLELDISVTQFPKFLWREGITNQFSFVYTFAKCQYLGNLLYIRAKDWLKDTFTAH